MLKKNCHIAEREENHKKSPCRSWARIQMGTGSLCEISFAFEPALQMRGPSCGASKGRMARYVLTGREVVGGLRMLEEAITLSLRSTPLHALPAQYSSLRDASISLRANVQTPRLHVMNGRFQPRLTRPALSRPLFRTLSGPPGRFQLARSRNNWTGISYASQEGKTYEAFSEPPMAGRPWGELAELTR